MLSSSSIALSGMNAAQTGLQSAAHNIANGGTSGFRRQQVEQASLAAGGVETRLSRATQPGQALAADMIEQLQSKNAFLANLAVFKTSDRMIGALLDTTG